MGQQPSTPPQSRTPNLKPPTSTSIPPNKPLTHQGILRIAKTPFQNCQKIEMGSNVYFLQNTRTNLQELVRHKMRIKKYFGEEEVARIIENVVYALGYLEEVGIVYPYLGLENVYVCGGKYKLLPPSTISPDIYTKLKSTLKQKTPQYIPASPQLIIACRCQQPQIHQPQLLFKSNIFALGLLLLQICTLKPSSQCYDLDTYDILDQVVMERIQEIEGRYTGRIVRIVANMLDYDYEERMMPREMSIWINRELNDQDTNTYANVANPNPHIKSTPSFPKNQIRIQNAEMIKSRLVEQKNTNCPQLTKSPKASTTNPNPAQQEQMQVQKPKQKFSENRMNQIRNKIIKEKIKAQKEIIEEKQLAKSRKKRTSSYLKLTNDRVDKDRINNRNLPNPYLNPNHLNKSTQKPTRNRSPYLPLPIQSKDLGIHDINKLRPFIQKYSYTNTQESGLTSERDLNRDRSPSNINLKYKYNVTDEEGESVRLSSNRKRDGDRFIRVEKCIAEFQRAGLSRLDGDARKYDYGEILGEAYEDRHGRKADRFGAIDERNDNRESNRSPHRNYQQATNISDFSFQPPKQKSRKPSKQVNEKPLQIQPQPHPLTPKQNQSDLSKSDVKKSQKNAPTYQRHQQLFNDTSKPIKLSKENDDIMMIKKQIERSKKLIQEVKRNQME